MSDAFPNSFNAIGEPRSCVADERWLCVILGGGADLAVRYPMRHAAVVKDRIARWKVISVRGALSPYPSREQGLPLLFGWNPERHLMQARADKLSVAPWGKLTGCISEILRRRIMRLTVVRTYKAKTEQQVFTLGLARRTARLFRATAKVGMNIEAMVRLCGEPEWPWDGIGRIHEFRILQLPTPAEPTTAILNQAHPSKL